MKKEITWTLGDGRKATYTVELELEKEINLDGDISTVPCCEINQSMYVPCMGFIEAYAEKLPKPVKHNSGKILVGKIGNIGITQDIYDQIQAAIAEVESSPEWQAKQTTIRRNEQEIEALFGNRSKNGYCLKCHSYCYGDCNNDMDDVLKPRQTLKKPEKNRRPGQ